MLRLLALTTATLLTACGGSSSDEAHNNTDIDTGGRLALFDTGASALKFLNLDDEEVLTSLSMDGKPPRLYASPDHRYAVAIQREDDRVSFSLTEVLLPVQK